MNLIQPLAEKLAAVVIGKSPDDNVFGLTAGSISMKITVWAKKAGVPHIHLHSFRHNFATDLFEKNANPRAVQVLMGHESLETTMRYSEVTGQHLRNTVKLLQKKSEVNGSGIQYPDQKGRGSQTIIYMGSPQNPKIRELSRDMGSGINLPSPWELLRGSDFNLEFRPGKYYLPIGTVEIDEDKQIKVNYHDICVGIAEPHLTRGLLSQLATSGLSKFAELVGDDGNINQLMGKAGQYSQALLELLILMTEESKD